MSNATSLFDAASTATLSTPRPTEGVLSVLLQARDGRTVLRECYAQAPLQLFRPVYPDDTGTAYLYVLNPCGGIVGGDTYRLTVTVGAGARGYLTTQAATLLYAAPTRPARQHITLTLERDAVLSFMPAQTIPFAHAAFHQDIVVRLGPGATVILGEILAPGRLARGEAFAYDTYTARLRVEDAHGDVLLLDHTRLHPQRQDCSSLGLFEGSYTYLGTLYALRQGTACDPALAQRLHAHLADRPGLLGSTTLLACGGLAVRLLAKDHTAAREALHAVWALLHDILVLPAIEGVMHASHTT
jgi:urease accessory protein